MDKARALVLAPSDAAGQRVRDTVRRALEELGIQTFRLDDLTAGASLVNAITDAIQASDFIVVAITRHNPNMFYELGYAHALRKPTILLMSSESDSPVPSDLRNLLYVAYDPQDLRSLKDEVRRLARMYAGVGVE